MDSELFVFCLLGYHIFVLEQVLLELALLFALCVAVAVTFHRLRLPSIVGFLVAGVVVGPHAIGLVNHEEMVRELAEVGIVVMLFAVGLEVPLSQLRRLRRAILFGGCVQILGTVLVTTLVCALIGMSWPSAVFLGFLLSLSSTAAATKMLIDHGELGAPHGRTVLGIAVAQDLAVVPMILLIPLLGSMNVPEFMPGSGVPGFGLPASTAAVSATPMTALLNFGALALIVVVARLLVKPLVSVVCGTRSRELFVLFLATWCLGLAVVTAHLGMSLALGAFLAGILLADSDHHSQAASEIEPFRDAFASLFFVSIGMLFDWATIANAPGTVAAIVCAVVGGKALIIILAARVLGQPFWVRIRAALTLAQVGEFSFVLVQLGQQSNLLPESAEALFIVAAVVSIAATPLLYALGHRLALRARNSGMHNAGRVHAAVSDGERSNHAILVGYGPTGRTVAAGLEAAGIPYVIAEMNAATVRTERLRGVPIVLADATRITVLNSLGLARAQLVVLAINDLAATQRVSQLVSQNAPQAHILARAQFNNDVASLQRSGAHEVVPQELEASVEILVRVLRRFLVADDEIGRRVKAVRAEAGGIERASMVAPSEASEIAEFVPGLGFAVRRVGLGAPVAGQTLKDAAVRRHTGCTVVAVRRADQNLTAIDQDTVLEVGDTVVVIGPQLRLLDAAAMFAEPAATEPPSAT
ncbi:MAG: CPA2 family monovalent cation:H+ antiporter-2 [Hyphomicrobiaceae bacterium]|jgi:CPA2 family monovalent cation:H+ antiporter-2